MFKHRTHKRQNKIVNGTLSLSQADYASAVTVKRRTSYRPAMLTLIAIVLAFAALLSGCGEVQDAQLTELAKQDAIASAGMAYSKGAQ